MKVAILNNLFPPNSRGGAEEAAKGQALDFLSRGDEVVVITLSPVNKKSVQIKGGIKTYELPHRNIFNYFNIGKHRAAARFLWHIIDTFNFWLANDIKKILKEENPDLVICHNMKGLSLLTLFVIRNSPFVIHQVVHDVQLYTPSGLIEYGKEDIFEHTGFLTRGYRFFTRRLFRHAEKVFFPSAWLLNFYRKYGFFTHQEKIYEPNKIKFQGSPSTPVVEDYFTTGQAGSGTNNYCPSAVEDAHQRMGLLYVGQLEPHKGILFLLDVFSLLSSRAEQSEVEGSHDSNIATSEISPRASLGRNDKFVLHIVGDGSLLPEIKKRAEANPNIIVHGRVAHEKLPDFYSRAKAVIFPSLVYENAPMVIAEALSCGAPVICSRLGGAPELIREGENGATFTPGDARDLAEKIKKFLL